MLASTWICISRLVQSDVWLASRGVAVFVGAALAGRNLPVKWSGRLRGPGFGCPALAETIGSHEDSWDFPSLPGRCPLVLESSSQPPEVCGDNRQSRGPVPTRESCRCGFSRTSFTRWFARTGELGFGAKALSIGSRYFVLATCCARRQ